VFPCMTCCCVHAGACWVCVGMLAWGFMICRRSMCVLCVGGWMGGPAGGCVHVYTYVSIRVGVCVRVYVLCAVYICMDGCGWVVGEVG